ncbi:hypothetical protein [Embleya sp. NBC_00896]|uniref:hypothetical protein n=1 Tax=Embleya sp. NBC_00896 TaxID=2975961 RepID=UPI003866BA8C|nr:hypothetical protein OG928_31905 [Embleya sp. NBC_00896]
MGGDWSTVKWDSVDMITGEKEGWARDTSGPDVPMVPVLQLYARDVPGVHWPDCRDVLQVLWCPNDHKEPPGQDGYWGPTVELRYRSSAAVGTVATPPRPERRSDHLLPLPCSLAPLEIADLPSAHDLPEDLHVRGRRWARARDTDFDRDLACRRGWKIGGWPGRHAIDPIPLDCFCGAGMRLLLTVESRGHDRRFIAGHFDQLRLFTCPANPSHPIRLNIQ